MTGMEKIVTFVHPIRAFRVSALSLAGIAALTLGGCSSSDKVDQLEQRLVTVEAKADAAEKRAKAAESFAARNAPQPFPPSSDSDVGPPEVDPDSNMVTDDSANDPAFDNNVSAPDVHGEDG